MSLLQIVNLVSYCIFIFTSAVTGPGLFTPSIGSISGKFPVLVTPAGWAFSIWSLIFVLVGVLSVVQALPRNRLWASERLGWWWALNAGLGEAFWPFSFTLQWGTMWPSAFILLFIVLTGAALYVRMGIGASPFAGKVGAATPSASLLELAVVHSGVSIYVGWTTAATILNFSIALSASGVNSNGEAWAATVCAAAATLAVAAAITRTDFLFAGTLCWALSAIHGNQVRLGLPTSAAQASLAAAGVAGAAAALAAATRVWLVASGRLALAPSSLKLGGEGAADSDSYKSAPTVVVANVLANGATDWAGKQ